MRRPSISTLNGGTVNDAKAPSRSDVGFTVGWMAGSKWLICEIFNRSHWLLTTEVLPSWNRFLRHFKTPLAVLVISSLVSLLCGWLVAPQILLLFAATICVISVGIVYPWIAVCAIDCRIDFPSRRVVEGHGIRPRLIVHNRWPIPVWGLAVQRGLDSWEDSESSADGVSVALAHTPAWSQSEFTWDVTPLRRGVYPRCKPVVTSAFPFGLWTASKDVTNDPNVIAWPVPIKVQPRCANTQRSVHRAETSMSVVGVDSDMIGIRPYRSGDVMRDVHWPATARLSELMVKERQRSSEARTRIELRVHPRVGDSEESNAALDWAIRIVAGLCDGCFQAPIPVTLQVGKRRFDVRSNRERRLAMDALSLASLEELRIESNDRWSGRASDSQVTVTLDADDGPSGSAAHSFTIQITAHMSGRTMRHRVETPSLAPRRIEDFHRECLRLSMALNGRDGHQGPPTRLGSNHVV